MDGVGPQKKLLAVIDEDRVITREGVAGRSWNGEKGRNCFTQTMKMAGGKKGRGTIYRPRTTLESRRLEDQEDAWAGDGEGLKSGTTR